MDFVRRNWREILVAALVLANLFVWLAVFERRPGEMLSVYFLDVGQGDAILIESPSKGRMLIDGGKNRQVLSELGKVLPFADKRIDVVLATHPDADHIGGLPEVVSRYDVGLFLESGAESDSSIEDELEKRLEERGVERMLARRGMVVNFGDGATLTIFFPNQDVSNWETNRASVVGKLTYGDIDFLLTGDTPLQIEQMLVNLGGGVLNVEVLQAPHHGSRTSTSLSFVQAASPEYAVISAGKDNSYGHPHAEVLQNLASVGAAIFGTYEEGAIEFETNGKVLKVK